MVRFAAVPVFCNVLCPTRAAALAVARGDIDLRSCPACGHVYNHGFDPRRMAYTPDYEASLQGSAVFRAYADTQARHLVAQYRLVERPVIEIGCGQGEFLSLLRHHGAGACVGFDPSYGGGDGPDPLVTITREYFAAGHAAIPADLIVCRQVLEHLDEPAALIAELRAAIGTRATAVFFEVPNQRHVIDGLGIWDIIYEHPSYYSASSLAALFTAGGFAITALYESFGGQFLCIEACPGEAATESTSASPMHDFARRCHARLTAWRRFLSRLRAAGRTAAIWGGGSKGIMFANLMAETEAVAAVVDVNPRKHGKYVPGTGQPILAPAALAEAPPAVILVMNPLYRAEIAAALADLGLSATIIPVGGEAPDGEIR